MRVVFVCIGVCVHAVCVCGEVCSMRVVSTLCERLVCVGGVCVCLGWGVHACGICVHRGVCVVFVCVCVGEVCSMRVVCVLCARCVCECCVYVVHAVCECVVCMWCTPVCVCVCVGGVEM